MKIQELKRDIEDATQSTWSFVGGSIVDLCSHAEYENKVRSFVSQLPAEVEVFEAPNQLKYIKVTLKV